MLCCDVMLTQGMSSICIGNSFSHALSSEVWYSGSFSFINVSRPVTAAPSLAPTLAVPDAPTPAPTLFGSADAVVTLTFKMVLSCACLACSADACMRVHVSYSCVVCHPSLCTCCDMYLASA